MPWSRGPSDRCGRRGAAAAVASLLALTAEPARAFVNIDFSTDMVTAPRWSAASHAEVNGKGLDGGIEVAVEPGFAEVLTMAVSGGALPEDVAAVEAATVAAFRAWENSVLRFVVRFDAAAVRGARRGFEIDLFVVPESDPAFANNPYFGVTHLDWVLLDDRALTNGEVGRGNVISGADIFLNIDMLAAFAPALTRGQQLAALQRLLTHEIGHAIGLHHPHDRPASNFDTDSDPYNAMLIDPGEPFAGLTLSPAINQDVVMSRQPTSLNTLLFTSLTRDDRGGRDVLYPSLGDVAEICTPMPETCRAARRSVLQLRDDGDDTKDAVTWKWLRGDATGTAEFGDPATVTRYSVCLYAGTTPALLGELALPDASKWMALDTGGFRYADSVRSPRGIGRARLRPARQDEARLVVRGRGTNLPAGLLPLGRSPVTIQLQRADVATCWGSSFEPARVTLDDGERQFKARLP